MKPIVSILFALALTIAGSTAARAAWTPFTPLGASTTATSNPSCANVASDHVACAVRNLQSRLAVIRFVGGAWTGWTALAGATITSDPSCVERAAGEVVCAARNNLGRLVYTIYSGGAWSPSAVAGGWSGWMFEGGSLHSDFGCASSSAALTVCTTIRISDSVLYFSKFDGVSWSFWDDVGGSAIGSPACAKLNAAKVLCVIVATGNKLFASVGP